jgi:hypothetical protein
MIPDKEEEPSTMTSKLVNNLFTIKSFIGNHYYLIICIILLIFSIMLKLNFCNCRNSALNFYNDFYNNFYKKAPPMTTPSMSNLNPSNGSNVSNASSAPNVQHEPLNKYYRKFNAFDNAVNPIEELDSNDRPTKLETNINPGDGVLIDDDDDDELLESEDNELLEEIHNNEIQEMIDSQNNTSESQNNQVQ